MSGCHLPRPCATRPAGIAIDFATSPVSLPGSLPFPRRRGLRFRLAAQSSVAQLPDNALDEHPIPNRPGSIRGLAYHIFRIVQSFLDAVEGKEPDWIVNSMQAPVASLATGKDIAAYGGSMRAALARWWKARTKPVTEDVVRTFQGEQSLHWFLERSAWHSAQHARQIEDVLARLGIEPHHKLSPEVLDGLPVPKRIWQ